VGSSGKTPTFSILMPAYNAAATIAESIASVLVQTRSDWELLVVDDGSTDHTAAIGDNFAAEDPRIHVLHRPNRGIGAARNTGLAAARGRLICLLDADDLYLPTYLERMDTSLQNAPQASVAYTQGWILNDMTGRIGRLPTSVRFQPGPEIPSDDPAQLLLELVRGNFVFIAAMVRSEAIQEVGGFDGSLTGSEDYDLWLRLAKAGKTMVRIPEPLVVYRQRENSVSNNLLRMAFQLHTVLTRVADDDDVAPETRSVAAKRAVWFAERRRRLEQATPLRLALSSLHERAERLAKHAAWRRYWLPAPPDSVAAARRLISARAGRGE
jgi:glycosyltransferase involved in cell wall biosynthesis